MTEHATTDDRRFAMKADAFYVRHDDGVWLRNNLGSFTIRGDGSYQLIASLFGRLDGRRSMAQICADLPGPARRSVSRLVETLERNGFVKQLHHAPEDPPDWMRERYPTHLAFLDHHGDRPVSRMHAVRAQPVACVGAGVALRAVVGALAEFGIARLTILAPAAETDAMAELAGRARDDDPEFDWRIAALEPAADAAFDPDRVARLPEIRAAAQVIVAVDDPDPAPVATLQGLLHARGQSAGVLGRCGDLVVALPGGPAQCCWECAWRRLTAPVTGTAAGLAPALTPATIGALHVVQRAFAALAGLTLDDADAVASVEPLAPIVGIHQVRRHPLCERHPAAGPAPGPAAPADEPVRPDLPFAEDDPALVAVSDRIVAVTAGWTDRRAGPLLAVGEGSVDQLPLAGSTCRVPDPAATAGAARDELILCRAVSPREARNQVVLFALERLATSTAEGRERLATRAAEGRARPGSVVYGAGWSVAEAVYRAGLAASRAALTTARTPYPSPGTPDRPVRAFLADTLAAAGRYWCDTVVERLPTGFVRAHLRTSAGPAVTGVGLDEDHAIDQALLHAAAALRPAEGAVVGHLAPPAATWAAALAEADRRGRCPRPLTDDPSFAAAALLPFLDGHAHLVAVRLPEE